MFGNGRPIGTTPEPCDPTTGKTDVPTDASVGPYSLTKFPSPNSDRHRSATGPGRASPATTHTPARPARSTSGTCRPTISR